jgi:hypothetical protein
MMNPARSVFFAVELISHKLLRYAVPLILAALLTASLMLVNYGITYAAAAITQTAFYLLALAGFLLERRDKRPSLLAMPLYFVLANLASAVAFYKFLKGERYVSWQPIR